MNATPLRRGMLVASIASVASVALIASGALATPAVGTGAGDGALGRPAFLAARAASAVLLDAASAGQRLVVVGERGIVLLSDDGGSTWRQAAAAPTRATLTSVHFASPTRGWVTGHGGLILETDDGGEHWKKQLDGQALAQAALAQARAAVAGTGDKAQAARALRDAERLVADGPDKPFFDLYAADPQRGFAVGAYNLFVRTDDGGATWVPASERLPNPKGNHLYAIRGQGERIFIAGEQGMLLRSTDGGRTFVAIESPYAGSFFTLALLPGGELIAAGLRGNAFRSTDEGDTWRAIGGLPPVSWLASAVAADGTAWLASQAGQVFVSHDAGLAWKPLPGPPRASLTGLLPLGNGELLATTMRGVDRITAAPSAAFSTPEKSTSEK